LVRVAAKGTKPMRVANKEVKTKVATPVTNRTPASKAAVVTWVATKIKIRILAAAAKVAHKEKAASDCSYQVFETRSKVSYFGPCCFWELFFEQG
jgi:hypothetical protein